MSDTKSTLHDLDNAISRGTSESRARALWHATDLLIAGRYCEDEIATFGEVIGRLADAIRAYVERDVETDGLAAAIFRCKLISAGFNQAQTAAAIAEYGIERRRRALPVGVVPLRRT